MKPNKTEPFWEKFQRGFRLLRVKFILIAAMLGIFTLAANSTMAQVKKVEGTVLSSTDKAPLPGVNVMIKGTATGTTTNADGKFSIAAANGQELVFSFIGYETQVVKYSGQLLTILLKDDSQSINEVVVVGYGVQKKKLVTGATIQVKSDDIKSSNSMIVGNALQGKTPGVTIVQSSGQPGSTPKIVIRGVGTNQDSGPLYIVDGVPTGDINFLNPNDIESIDVLKDAASTAIYGARASNGIILVTTKKGSYNSKMSISYDGNYGVQNLGHKVQMANAYEYATLINESNHNIGKGPAFTTDQVAAFKSGNTPFGKGTDWQDEIFRKNTPFQNHILSLSGGNEVSMYSSSLSYSDQKGLVGDESDYQRISFRFNSEHKVIDNFLKFGQNLTYTNTVDQGVNTGSYYNNTMRGMFLASPLCPVYDSNTEDGYGRTIYSDEASSNPVASLYFKNQTKKIWDRVLGNAYFDFSLLKGLKFKTTVGLDLSYGTENTYAAKDSLSIYDVNKRSRAYQGMSKSLKYTLENVLTYDYVIGKHTFKALAGTSLENTDGFNVNGSMEDLILQGLPNAVINNGTNMDTKKVNGSKSTHRLTSFFGRLNYNYDEKYLLTAIFRRDGSSNFKKQWGNFTSLSLGWNISNERFMEGTKDWLTSLKIRGGWGQNGNQNVPYAYPYAALITKTAAGYYFDGSKTLSVGGYLERIPNPDLVWETAEEISGGLDAILFNKLSLTVDLYKKTTKDWILQVPVPALVGTSGPTVNGGDVENKGVEVSVGFHDKIGELGYNVSTNLTYNKNVMNKINNDEGIITGSVQVGSSNMDEMYRMQEGHSIGFFYGLKTNGIFQNEADVKAYNKNGVLVQPNAQPGDVRFVDQNGDGVIDKNDKVDLGSYLPKVTVGFNLGLDYKKFDFSMNVIGSFGNKIANCTRPFDRGYYNYSSKFFDRWHGEGTSNKYPRLTDGSETNGNWSKFSDLYLEDGDYVRIKNVNLGYTIFSPSEKKGIISQLRIFVSATNLYTFTKYKGLDPEIATGTTDSWSGGVDVGFYPQPRTYMVGLSVKF
jgi:TonB-dependent starch-binding outer membrane protein SusC